MCLHLCVQFAAEAVQTSPEEDTWFIPLTASSVCHVTFLFDTFYV